jgi:hypothetical protein
VDALDVEPICAPESNNEFVVATEVDADTIFAPVLGGNPVISLIIFIPLQTEQVGGIVEKVELLLNPVPLQIGHTCHIILNFKFLQY